MIVIEGADCVGKTTFCHRLIQHLSEVYELPDGTPVYQHLSRLPHGVNYRKAHLSLIAPNIVRDRFHMSEVVYATALQRPMEMDPTLYAWIDAQLVMLGGMVVVLTADDEIIKYRYNKRVESHGKGSEMFPLDVVLDVNDRYRAIGQMRVERADLAPGRTFDDKGDPTTRWVGSRFKDARMQFKVDYVVHQTFTNSDYDFDRGIETVAGMYVERQENMRLFHQRS